jgi:hypothetical protein
MPPATKPDDAELGKDMLWNIIESCWRLNPEERISAGQVNALLRNILWASEELVASTTTPTSKDINSGDIFNYLSPLTAFQSYGSQISDMANSLNLSDVSWLLDREKVTNVFGK